MKKIISVLKNKKGAALAAVIMVFVVMIILSTAVLTVSLAETKSAAGVESVTTGYYLARSAVSIAADQIDAEFSKLNQLQRAVDEESDATLKAAALDNYNAALTAFRALGIVPAAENDTKTLKLSGILDSGDAEVVIAISNIGGEPYLTATCTVEVNGMTSTASARLGKYIAATNSYYYSQSTDPNFDWLNDAIYTWGDMDFNKAPKLNNGTLSAGGNITNATGNSGVARDLPILKPPAEYMAINKVGTSKATAMCSSNTKMVTITASDSGYYGDFYAKNNVNWGVDTSAGDVVLIFSSIYAKNNFEITVTSPATASTPDSQVNHLYIYIVEPYTAGGSTKTSDDIIYVKNNLTITSSSAYSKPLAYVIYYNDSAQKYIRETGGNNLVPADSVNTVINHMDTATFCNNAELEAYFYLPGMDLSINKNNFKLTGAMYVGEFYTKNNAVITFDPAPGDDLMFAGFQQTDASSIEVEGSYDSIGMETDRVWLK